ncbi:hypothetical protein Hanom_Chr01g00084941 [Helianthus anomalus]
MSDQWPADSKVVPVLKFQDREARLWQAAFPTFGGSMGVRPLKTGEEYWHDQIKGHFMYPVANAFAVPPTPTEGAHIPNPRPLRALTSAGKEIVYLSSEESVGSSNGERRRNPRRRRSLPLILMSPVRRAEVVGRRLLLLEKKIGAVGSKSSGSAGSRNLDTEATPASIAHDEEEEEEEAEEPAVQLIRKRVRETTVGASVVPNPGGVPLIGKRSNLRSLYRFSPEAGKKTPEKNGVVITEPSEPAQKKPRVTIKMLKAAGAEAD